MASDDGGFFDNTRFLRGDPDPRFQEIDRACLFPELFQNVECQRKVLPLYFFLTRNPNVKMSQDKMKKQFRCGAELIKRVRESIDERKPIQTPGRKRTKPVRENVVLVQLVDATTRENGGASDMELAKLFETSRASINRIRHDLQYSYKPLRHAPFMTTQQIETRLHFCTAHCDDDWEDTLFTDESRFATSPDSPVMWWIKKGDAVYSTTVKFPFSIMVWGGIIGDRKTELIKCPKTLNAKTYVEMLDTHGIPTFMQQNGPRAIFQQDGARCHTARTTKRWFEEKNIRLLEGWPANSPDLSPIEQIWAITKVFIIRSYGMKSPLRNDQLEGAVFDAYRSIEPRTIAILTRSVKFRVQLCIAREGKFVGDKLDECCRRAEIELDSLTNIEIIPFEHEGYDGEDREGDGENEARPQLPSFTQFL